MPRISRQRILDDLADAKEQMQRWHDASPKKIAQEQEEFDADWEDYAKAMRRVIRAARTTYPDLLKDRNVLEAVYHYVSSRRALGEWDELRKIGLGLEVVVQKPPYPAKMREDVWVFSQTEELWRQGKERPEEIRRMLSRKLNTTDPLFDPKFLNTEEAKRLRKRLKAMTRQGFHDWLKRLGLALDLR